ncbi:MAG: hypothetical protein AAGG81_08755, partial [Chlamydiota bacterium]
MGIHDTSSHLLNGYIPYDEESKRLYESVTKEPIWAKKLAKGIVKLHQRGIPYKGDCKRFYEALIEEPFFAKKLADEKIEVVEKIVKILSSQLPQIHDESGFTINCFSDFYEVDEYVTDTVVELVQKIPMYMFDVTLNASINGPCFYLL